MKNASEIDQSKTMSGKTVKLRSGMLVAAAFVIAVAVAAVAIGAYRTYSNQGEIAISRMSPSELAWLEKVKLIRKGMSYREVRMILGYPDHENQGFPSDWRVNDSRYNRISVYFGKNGVEKIRWKSYGCFTYEPFL